MHHRFCSLYSLLLFSALTLGLVSCSSSTGPGGDEDDVSSYYLPLSRGTTWTYEGSAASIMILDNDTTINGKTYVITSRTGQPNSYNRREGTTVYQFDPQSATEFPYLKEESIGTTWTQDVVAPTGDTIRASFAVISYDSSRIVKGKKYSDILHVQIESKTKVGSNWQTFSTGQLYFARGIGLIEQKYSGAGSVANMKLISFDVKGSTATAETTTEQEEEDPNASPYVKAKVNGVNWNLTYVSTLQLSGSYVITSSAGNGNGISIMLDNLAPGTYQINSFAPPTLSLVSATSNEVAESGTLVITASDGTSVEGTFSFDGSDGSEVRDGSFKAVFD